MYPEELRYTSDHEWIGRAGGIATIGISFFAQKELGDVVFVELPEVGRHLRKGEELGTIESVKAVSEIYSPATGDVVEVNTALRDSPELVNKEPYGRGWILKLRLENAGELEDLMDAPTYEAHVGKGGH